MMTTRLLTAAICAASMIFQPTDLTAQSLIPILPIPPDGQGSRLLAVGATGDGEFAAVHSYSTKHDSIRRFVSRSQDGGFTWQASHEISDDVDPEDWGFSPHITPDSLALLQTADRVVEGPDGIQVGYRELRGNSSYDLGRTWNEGRVLNPGLLLETLLLAQSPSLESTTVRERNYELIKGPGNSLYALWERHFMRFRVTDGFTRYSNQRLLLRRSDNGGRTWNPEAELEIPLNLENEERSETIDFFAAVDEMGKIGFIYTVQDCSLDPELQAFKSKHFFISSADGGRTWTAPTRIPTELCDISGLAAGPADTFVVHGFNPKIVQGEQVNRTILTSTHDAGKNWLPPHVIPFPEGNFVEPIQICWNGGQSWTGLTMDPYRREEDENFLLEYQSLDNASTWLTPRRHVANRRTSHDRYLLSAIGSDQNGTTIAFIIREYFPLEDSDTFNTSTSFALPLIRDFKPLPRLSLGSTVVGWQLR